MADRVAPILLAIFFENRRLKAKSKILEKQESENCNLAYFALQIWKYSTRIVTNRIKSTHASGKTA